MIYTWSIAGSLWLFWTCTVRGSFHFFDDSVFDESRIIYITLDDSERSNHLLHTENPLGSTELSLNKIISKLQQLAGHPTSITLVQHRTNIPPSNKLKKPPALIPNHPFFFFHPSCVHHDKPIMEMQTFNLFFVDGRNPALLGGSSHLVLITMVSKSPDWGCSLYKRPKWLINGGY